jgi:hypothetical protein
MKYKLGQKIKINKYKEDTGPDGHKFWNDDRWIGRKIKRNQVDFLFYYLGYKFYILL